MSGVVEAIGAAGFAGSPITEWCATCQDWAVPMSNGTCGFCGEKTAAGPTAAEPDLGPPTELGQVPAPPPRLPRYGRRRKLVVGERQVARREPLTQGQEGFGVVCACGGPKAKQAHQCRACYAASGRAGGKGTPRPAMRGPYGVSEDLMLEAHRMYNDEQLSLREIARRIYDQTYGYSSPRSLGEALYRGFRNRGWALRTQSDATRLRNWKHGLKTRTQTADEQNAYRHWLAQQRGWSAVQGPGQPTCKGHKTTSPGKGAACTRRAQEGSDYCYSHDPARADERAAHLEQMRSNVPREEQLERLRRMRAKAAANAERRRTERRVGAAA